MDYPVHCTWQCWLMAIATCYYKQCVVRLQMFDQITSFQLLTLSEVMVLYYMITNTDLIGFQELS